MLSIVKNDWQRVLSEKFHVLLAVGLTVCALILSIVLTTKVQARLNIAVIGRESLEENSMLDVTYLTEVPAQSELVQGRYDAVLSFHKDGSYDVDTIKNDDFKAQLRAAINGDKATFESASQSRKIGTNIIGFMLMFLLMQGVLYARSFADDKEKHIIERVIVSPIGFAKYLTGHIMFAWFMVVIPSFLVIVVTKLIGIEIGFTLCEYAVLFAVLGILSTCFAMCITSFFLVADDANMTANVLIVMSTVLSGSFYSIASRSKLLDKVMYVIPQKGFLHFVRDWENNMLNFKDMWAMVYVIICSIVLVIIGIIKTRKDYCFRR